MSDGQPEQAPKITQNGQFEEVVQFSPEPNPNKLAESPESANFGRLFGRQPRLPEHRRAASRARYQGCTAIRCFKSNKPVPVYTPLDAPHGMGTRSVIEQPNAVVPFAVHLAALRVVNEVCQRLLVRLRVATFVEGHVVRANALVQRWEAFKLCQHLAALSAAITYIGLSAGLSNAYKRWKVALPKSSKDGSPWRIVRRVVRRPPTVTGAEPRARRSTGIHPCRETQGAVLDKVPKGHILCWHGLLR